MCVPQQIQDMWKLVPEFRPNVIGSQPDFCCNNCKLFGNSVLVLSFALKARIFRGTDNCVSYQVFKCLLLDSCSFPFLKLCTSMLIFVEVVGGVGGYRWRHQLCYTWGSPEATGVEHCTLPLIAVNVFGNTPLWWRFLCSIAQHCVGFQNSVRSLIFVEKWWEKVWRNGAIGTAIGIPCPTVTLGSLCRVNVASVFIFFNIMDVNWKCEVIFRHYEDVCVYNTKVLGALKRIDNNRGHSTIWNINNSVIYWIFNVHLHFF